MSVDDCDEGGVLLSKGWFVDDDCDDDGVCVNGQRGVLV